jgi:hypothetical protein
VSEEWAAAARRLQAKLGSPGRVCHYCGPTDRELRPYGPGGSTVCFPCATATPERNAAAQGAFGALLDGSAAITTTGVIAIGEADGPRPFDPAEAVGPTPPKTCSSCNQPMDSPPCSLNRDTGWSGHTVYGGVGVGATTPDTKSTEILTHNNMENYLAEQEDSNDNPDNQHGSAEIP